MFWIHGGAFKYGSGNDDVFGPEFLVRHDVILVTINYRLEILGFLCLDTKDVPGNAGMKDQVAALRWVNRNIEKFGGDPGNVTIFGNSAGAMSVSYHLVSPMTKGLFKRAIAQSGASTCWVTLMSEPRERALQLAKKLGLQSENDKEVYEFFKSLPLEKLVGVQSPFITLAESLRPSDDSTFILASEKKFDGEETFFSGHPYEVLRQGIHEGVEVMTGYTEDEGVYSMGNDPDLEKKFNIANSFKDYLIPKPMLETCPSSQQLEAGNKIRKFYFGDKKVSMETVDEMIKYNSMYVFTYGTLEWAKICTGLSENRVYFYKFTAKSRRNIFSKIFNTAKIVGSKPVTTHADELGYMFPLKMFSKEVDKESNEFKYIERVTKLWTNMAKYGYVFFWILLHSKQKGEYPLNTSCFPMALKLV